MPLLLLALLLAGPWPARRDATALSPPRGRGEGGATLFHGGRIRLGVGQDTVVEAILVRDGRVVAAGGAAELEARAGEGPLSRHDLAGGVGVPGLQDAHVRLGEAACEPYFVSLQGCEDLAQVHQRIAAAAASTPEGEWIEARGLLPSMLPAGGQPDHAALNAAFPDHPVVLRSADGEAALLNAQGLRKARIVFGQHGFPHVAGGRVVKGEDGAPSGLILGNAVVHLRRLLPESHLRVPATCLLRAQEGFFARGVTCVHVMEADRALLEDLERLRASGLWKLRVRAWLDGKERIDERLARQFAPDREGGGRLAVLGVHLRVDGTLAWEGGALLDSAHNTSRAGAALRTSTAGLAERLREAARLGLSPALEAHGDRGARIALDLIESIGVLERTLRGLRPRVEGADLVAPRDWERFPDLGVVVSIQPLRADVELVGRASELGEEREREARSWWALAPELGGYALGSGWPATDGDLLAALASARRAHEPLEAAGLLGSGSAAQRALAGFTVRAAEAARDEAIRGLLAPGFAADMTVLDVDPLTCSPEELEAAHVLMTVIEGEVVYEAGVK